MVATVLAPDRPLVPPTWRAGLRRLAMVGGKFTGFADPGPAGTGLPASSHPPKRFRKDDEFACSRTQLAIDRDGREWRRPLPCRCWRCERCARKLRFGVIALAASGQPNRMLTLTCSPDAVENADDARDALHSAWRILRLAIARELAKATTTRWNNKNNGTTSGLQTRCKSEKKTAKTGSPAALPYFAVVERHKSGRPHLHILLRSDFIPQR